LPLEGVDISDAPCCGIPQLTEVLFAYFFFQEKVSPIKLGRNLPFWSTFSEKGCRWSSGRMRLSPKGAAWVWCESPALSAAGRGALD